MQVWMDVCMYVCTYAYHLRCMYVCMLLYVFTVERVIEGVCIYVCMYRVKN